MAGLPTVFFNADYHFDLGEAALGNYPFRTISVNSCFFMKRDGTFVTSEFELFSTREELIIVRCVQQRNCILPDRANFDNYPELFDPNNPDAYRGSEGRRGQDIGENQPFKIWNI